MNRSLRRAGYLIPLAAFAAGTLAASACGFEDPKGVDAARGALNWIYPDALHVTSAVWRAQKDGVVARDARPEAVRALFGYRKVTSDLAALRDRLTGTMEGGPVSAFSIVLIGPVLWSRFVPVADRVSFSAHTDGPQRDDIVIVTDEPVVAALVAGRITPLAAQERGLIRFYGPPDKLNTVAAWLQRLPAPGADEKAATAITAGPMGHQADWDQTHVSGDGATGN